VDARVSEGQEGDEAYPLHRVVRHRQAPARNGSATRDRSRTTAPRWGKAAKSVAHDGGSWIRLDLKGERRLGDVIERSVSSITSPAPIAPRRAAQHADGKTWTADVADLPARSLVRIDSPFRHRRRRAVRERGAPSCRRPARS